MSAAFCADIAIKNANNQIIFMEIQGYCRIKKTATTGRGAKDYAPFLGETLRVMEFASDGGVMVGVMVVNAEGTALASFDKVDVERWFSCKAVGDVLVPPDLGFADQLLYYHKVTGRKGGYNRILKQMVIEASLHKGRLNDNLLFSLENNPNYASNPRTGNFQNM